MNHAIECNLPAKKLLERINSFNVSDFDLMKELEISEATLRKYKQEENAEKKQRKTVPRTKLIVLDFAINLALEKDIADTFEVLKQITIEDTSLIKFINENAAENLILLVIKQTFDLLAKSISESKNPLKIYREQFGHLNDETLEIAGQRDPHLLIKLINDSSLRPSTRADILESLAYGARKEYYDFIFQKTKESSPHIREAAFNALFEYYDNDPKYSFLKKFFKDSLEKETSKGVKETLQELIEETK